MPVVGAVLTWANKGRLAAQSGVGRVTIAKSAVTLVALAATGYSRVLGQRLMDHEKVPVMDGTTPVEDTPPDVKKIQQQLKILQYAVPAHVGALIAISAVMGEQQRTAQVARGWHAACCPPDQVTDLRRSETGPSRNGDGSVTLESEVPAIRMDAS
jgi:hypothetical protein